jgi:hypothetical protein
MSKIRHLVIMICIASFVSACSKGGGMYDKNDPTNNQFSVVNTLLVGVAVVGAVAAVEECRRHKCASGGGGYSDDPEWDYLQASGQWACRNAVNGQFMDDNRCYAKPMVDNWPNT